MKELSFEGHNFFDIVGGRMISLEVKAQVQS